MTATSATGAEHAEPEANGRPELRLPASSATSPSSDWSPRTTLPRLMLMPVSIRGMFGGLPAGSAGSALSQSCSAFRSTRGESISSWVITGGPPSRVCHGRASRPREASRIGALSPWALSVMPDSTSAGRGNRVGLAGLARFSSNPTLRAWVCSIAVKRSGCSSK